MKKIFVLTGEPSGDILAAKIISQLKNSKTNVEFLSVGGEHLKALNVKSIYNLSEITYLGFTEVLFNIFNIKKKIKETVKEIVAFKPDILFSVDSPDFTLRVAKEVKKLNNNIKVIHFVAPQVWIWRESRVKKLKSFIDHILLLFPFEKKYFDKENIKSTFIGHPLLEKNTENKENNDQLKNDKKKIISIFPGSRLSEINILTPILLNFVKIMNKKYKDLFYVFHSTKLHFGKIQKLILNHRLDNCSVVFDSNAKYQILKSSIFAVAKSGTVSLEICKAQVPSVIIYKMNLINFLIIKMLIKVKFANIINIAANKEIIPELLQSKCNSRDIFNVVDNLLNSEDLLDKQKSSCLKIINEFKTDRSSELASSILFKYL